MSLKIRHLQTNLMQEDIFSDATFEAKLNSLKLDPKRLECQNAHQITRMCMNPECKTSLSCNDDECKYCGLDVHPYCKFIPLSRVTNLFNDRLQKYKHFVLSMIEIDNNLIKDVRQHQKKLMNLEVPIIFQQRHQKIINEVYQNKNAKYLSGQDAQNNFKSMGQLVINQDQNISNILETYKGETEKLMEKRNCLLQEFVPKFELNSEVLKVSQDAVSEGQYQFLRKILNYPKDLTLLFRGSENKFKAQTFHKKCDNILNTLTLVKTQFDKIIGGFTSHPWDCSQTWINDQKKQTFLFSLNLKEKMIPINNNKLICRDKDYGPCFGKNNGVDLYLSDQCNSSKKSGSEFPSSYNHEGKKKYQKNQQTFIMFTGATNGSKFNVIEYEVFKVIFN